MPKFTVFSSKKIIKVLRENGFDEVRQKGSHKIFWNETTKKHVTVPTNKKDLPIGTAKSIFVAAGIEW